MSKAGEKPQVIGEVESRQTVDFAEALDGWTLDEIQGYVEGEDEGGEEFLAADAYVIEEDVDVSMRRKDLEAYYEWRKALNLTGRITP